MNDELLAVKERRLRRLLVALSIGFFVSIVGYLYGGFIGGENFPFVANSTAKDGLFLALSLLAIRDIRRFGWLAWLVMFGHAILAVTLILLVVTGNINMGPIDLELITVDAWIAALAWGLVDVAIVIALHRLLTAVARLRWSLKYLSPLRYVTVRALSEVLISDEQRQLSPDQIARNVEVYLAKFNAKSKWKVKLALTLLAPFAALGPNMRRRWLENMTEGKGRFFGPLGKALQPVIGVGAQLVYFGYYGDPDSYKSIGYTPFEQRPDAADRLVLVDLARPKLRSLDPEKVEPKDLQADYVIVGSGAAGAVLAFELAARGRSVLVLERGKHVDPSQFSAVETDMLSDLYSDGAIQISRDTRFAVLQGMCVGGSTVVNNAVCIRAPDDVLDRWSDASGEDLERLEDSYTHIESWLRVREQSPRVFARGAQKFLDGVKALHLEDEVHVVKANIAHCLGCGYCNIGCKYGKKLSMLDTVLPWAQERFKDDDLKDRVRILPQCMAKRIEMDGPTATAVLCELGKEGKSVRVHAKEGFVVSAGAIHSSLLLRRSRIGLKAAGKGLAFNMATPLTAHFKEKLNSYDGLQISHYLRPENGAGYVIETWFNPPAMQSLFMPGWCGNHYDNMDEYDQMACAGVVVGTQSNGNVRWDPRGDFDFTPKREDLQSLMNGVKQLGKIFFAAGATRVMPSTYAYRPFGRNDNLDALDEYVSNRTGISLNSAHPQGGNAISATADKGVVDSSFKVHELANVYVCDASVFPSSITVNPQYTVMALAHYAATKITGEKAPKRERSLVEERFGDPPIRTPEDPGGVRD